MLCNCSPLALDGLAVDSVANQLDSGALDGMFALDNCHRPLTLDYADDFVNERPTALDCAQCVDLVVVPNQMAYLVDHIQLHGFFANSRRIQKRF